MPQLSDTQAVLLSAAAARRDFSVLPPPDTVRLKGAALDRTLRALVTRGLIAEEAKGSKWASNRLVVTPSGLAAIGVETAESAREVPVAASDREKQTHPEGSQRPGGKPLFAMYFGFLRVAWVIPVRIAEEGEASASPLRAGRGRQKVPRRLAADDRLPWFRRNVRPLCELRRLSFRWLRWSAGMQRIDWIAVRLAALSAVSFAIGACSSDLSSTVLRTPDDQYLRRTRAHAHDRSAAIGRRFVRR